MPLRVGSTLVTKAYLGSTELDRIYVGGTLVFRKVLVEAASRPSRVDLATRSTVSGGFRATWPAATNADSYVLNIQEAAIAWGSDIAVSGTTYDFTGTVGTLYRVRVKSIRANAPDSGFTTSAYVRAAPLTVGRVPGIPTLSKSPASGRTASLTLRWTAVANATGYRVEFYSRRFGLTDFEVVRVSGGSTSSATLSNPIRFVPYYAIVRAERGSIVGLYSRRSNTVTTS